MSNMIRIVLMSTVLKKFDKNGKGSRKALGMGNCSINI